MRISIFVVTTLLALLFPLAPACSSFRADSDPDKVCMSTGTAENCASCCMANHSNGSGTFFAARNQCACTGTSSGAAGVCATECATTQCATPSVAPQANSTCDKCLQNATTLEQCSSTIQTMCQAVPDCTALNTCVTRCTTDAGAEGGADVSDPACKNAGSLSACQSCCNTNHDHGFAVYLATYYVCACTGYGATSGNSSGICAAECADSACKGSIPITGSACDNCLNQQAANNACNGAAYTACMQDSDCSAMFVCRSACQ